MLASQFVIPSSESSLCIFVYKVLEAFARCGDRRDNIQVTFAPNLADEDYAVDEPVLPIQLSEVVLCAEDFVRSTLAQGAAGSCLFSGFSLLTPRQAEWSSSSMTQTPASPDSWWR